VPPSPAAIESVNHAAATLWKIEPSTRTSAAKRCRAQPSIVSPADFERRGRLRIRQGIWSFRLIGSEPASESEGNMSMSPFAMIRVVFVAVLCSAFIGAADAQVSPQLAQKAPEAAEIAATATQQGFVRVIVQIAAPSMPTELRPDAAFLDPIRSQIATLQDGIIASHFGNATSPSEGQGFSRNLVRFEIRPLIAVNVSNAELDALAADPSIVFIQYDRPAPPTLLQSVPLIGMTPAVYNAGVTGSRQAVAVLDTGAQANHQFLGGNMFAGGLLFRSVRTFAVSERREVANRRRREQSDD
jgi:hypothetical protein